MALYWSHEHRYEKVAGQEKAKSCNRVVLTAVIVVEQVHQFVDFNVSLLKSKFNLRHVYRLSILRVMGMGHVSQNVVACYRFERTPMGASSM